MGNQGKPLVLPLLLLLGQARNDASFEATQAPSISKIAQVCSCTFNHLDFGTKIGKLLHFPLFGRQADINPIRLANAAANSSKVVRKRVK